MIQLRCILVCWLCLLAQSALAAAAFRGASSSSVFQTTPVYAGVGAAINPVPGSGNIAALPVVAERNTVNFCIVEQRDNVAISFSPGWTMLYSLSQSANHRASMFYKISGEAETNPTVTHPGGNVIVARCMRVRGVDANNLFDVGYAAQYAASSTTSLSGSMTTRNAGDMILLATHAANSLTATAAPTGPNVPTLTRRINFPTSVGLKAYAGLYTGVQAVAGPTGPTTSTLSLAAENHGVLIALRNGSTLTIAKPNLTVTDDVMVAAITVVPTTAVVTPPAGWQPITSTNSANASRHKLLTYYKVATASEPAFYTWGVAGAHTGTAGGITSFSGVNTASPISANATAITASSVSHTAPSVTTTTGNDMLVTIHTMNSSPYTSSTGSWTPPNLMTEAVDERSRSTASTSGLTLEMNYLALSSAGATGTFTATTPTASQKDFGITATIALRSNNALDHLQIDFPQTPMSSCAATAVTVYACASSGTSCANLYTGGVSGIVLSPGGGTISIPVGAGATSATVSRAAGTSIALAASSSAPYANTCKNLSTSSMGCNVDFAATVLTLNVPNFVSGKSAATTATACTVVDGPNNVSFYSTYNNPSSGTMAVSVAPQTGGVCGTYTPVGTSAGSATTVSLTFASNVAPLCITYPDVGNVKLTSTQGSATATSFFTAVPDRFVVSGASCVSGCVASPANPSSPGNPGATSATGYGFMKAGSPFTVNVTAYNGATPSVKTPNFGKESTPAQVVLTPAAAMSDLAGAVTGSLTCSSPSGSCGNLVGGMVLMGGFGSTTSGVASNSLVYDEVGNMTITPSLYDPYSQGYLSIGSVALNPSGTVSGSIGRFIPDHFSIAKDAVSPLLVQPDFAQVAATATGTSAPGAVDPLGNIIDVDDSTGFIAGAKIRINSGGVGGNAMTAKITKVLTGQLVIGTALSTDLSAGDVILQEWGTYMGEAFNAQFTLQAQNAANNSTQNYQGAYAKLNPNATNNPFSFAAVSGVTNLTSRLVTSAAASGTFTTSGATVVAPLSIGKAASPDGPYAALALGIAPVDSDGVAMGNYDMSVGGSTNRTSIMDATVQANTELRYGRVKISNAYGSELLSLAVPIAVQYWNGTTFVTATDDAATTLGASGIVLGAALGSLSSATGASVSNTCVPTPLPTTITLTNAAGVFCLASPGTRGNVTLTSNTPSYLGSNSAVANFGVYKSPLIYRRENY